MAARLPRLTMPALGDNLTARAVAILIGCFVLFAALVVAVMLWPAQGGGAAGLFDLPVPEETAAIVRAVEASTPESRPLVLAALNSSVTAVHLEPAFAPVSEDMRRAPELEWMFARYTHVLADRAFRVDLKRGGIVPALILRQAAREGQSVRLTVALRTGGVLVVEHRPPTIVRSYIARFAAIAGAGAIILLIGLAVAVRQTARPVSKLADAARRFSLDGEIPPLPIGGPQEVRALSAAFNDMQARIRDLVGERTRLLAAVAHDLRTYLTRLRLRAEFIADPDQRERAERDIEEMSALIDDTLLFAGQTAAVAGPRTPCNVREEIEALVRQRGELGEPVTLAMSGPDPGSLVVNCGALALRRMLNNLVENAIQYGSVARIAYGLADDKVWITVQDEGPGLLPDQIETVTRPFMRLETSRARTTGGAGLGLAIVKGLAEGCEGRLDLDNAANGGLAARVTLPMRAG